MTHTPQGRRSLPAQAPDGTKYRVVAAKKGQPFRDNTFDSTSLNPLEWLLGVVVNAVVDLRADGSPSWKVGVIRVGRLGWERFAHKELLPPGVDPGPRIDELVDSITRGLHS